MRWLWLAVLVMLVVTVAVVRHEKGPSVAMDGAWVLDRVQTASVDQTLHGPDDFRPGLGIGATRAYVDQGCGGFEFDLENTTDRLHFALRQQDRSYGPCSGTDSTPGHWDSWLSRVDHAARRGSTLVLTGPDLRLVWHAANPPRPANPKAASNDGGWMLVSVRLDETSLKPSRLHPATLSFFFPTVGIDTGCHLGAADFGGSSYGPLRFELDHRPRGPCAPGLDAVDDAVFTSLRRTRRARTTADRMVLSGRGSRMTFRRLAFPDMDSLANTHWRLRSRVLGSVTTSARNLQPVRAGERVGFSDIDGVMTVETGCRSLESGTSSDGAGKMSGFDLPAPCARSTSLDTYLSDVFGDPWWFKVVGDTLHVQGYSGRGLIYRRVG